MRCNGALLLFSVLLKGAFAIEGVYDPAVLEEAALKFEDLVRKHGYPAEVHKVTTRDDYILTLHRIPYGLRCGPEQPKRSPVLMMHGLLSNSLCWLTAGPEKALAYILADRCYDVWLGNNRGNAESREHRTLTTKNRAFWDFSWHEMGKYDDPALIEYILNATNEGSLHYIGHSQGTTQFFVFNSLYPEFSSKIRSFQALAPVAYLSHLKSPVGKIRAFGTILEDVFRMIGPTEFLPTNDVMTALGRLFCSDRYPASQALCSNFIFLISGFDSEQFNTTLMPLIIGPAAGGGSVKELLHYLQNIRSGGFRQYDYSRLLNQVKYGSAQPPSYNLKNVLAPVALHYGLNDWFVDLRDLERLASELPNLIGKFLVPRQKFNHVDFLWAIDAKTLLYDRVLDIMDQY